MCKALLVRTFWDGVGTGILIMVYPGWGASIKDVRSKLGFSDPSLSYLSYDVNATKMSML